MPIYTQYLTTFANPGWNNGTPTNNGSLNSVKWNLNWDDIFRMENHKHKHCRVKIKLLMTSFTAISTDWETYLGYLTCNLQSITSGYSTYGTVLSLTNATDCPTTGTTTHCMILDTTNESGIDVIPPKGNQEFTLTFSPMDLTKARTSNIYDYQAMLYFELYDEFSKK